eukprot:11067495-Lingulodinium_polyedra.AAC.1
MWEPLVEEAAKRPDDPVLQGWIRDLTTTWGSDIKRWPQVGCGSNFYPWKKGASMVVEIQTQAGEWMSFMSDRLPSQLDDAIKGVKA